MYSVYEGDALEDDIAKGRGDDDVDLVVWLGIFVVREIVVLNAITTATTHKRTNSSLQMFMSSHFIGSDSIASHQRGIVIVGFVETN